MPSPDEEARHALWLAQRERRAAYRAYLEGELAGPPAARMAAQAAFQPLVNYSLELQREPEPDEVDSLIVANQDIL